MRDVLGRFTTDKNIRYQQNLKGHHFAIVVLGNPQKHISQRVSFARPRSMRPAERRSRGQLVRREIRKRI